jgi:hypothetical protein
MDYRDQNPDAFKPRITLAPIYSYHVATEVGMFDYSLRLSMRPSGAVVERVSLSSPT